MKIAIQFRAKIKGAKKAVAYTFGLAMVSISIMACGGGPDDPIEPTPTPTPIENKAPSAYGSVDIDNGKTGSTFYFSANQSNDPEGKPMTYVVDVDGDGTYDTSPVSTNTKTSHIYNQAINANPRIQVKDDKGLTSVYNVGKVGIWATDADKP